MRSIRINTYIAVLIFEAILLGPTLAQEAPAPFTEPTPAYLKQFAKPATPQFVFERFDATGALYERSIDPLISPVTIKSATSRVINGRQIELRGLTSCPRDLVAYSGGQTWACNDAAADFMNAIYNERASVVLCKTLVLQPSGLQPASCFALVGDGKIDAFSIVNDDDTMVFLGLADIRIGKDGQPMRPDLIESASLSRTMNGSADDQ